MKKVALVVDNSGSLTQQEMEKIKVTKMIPISFIVNGEEYYENRNMSSEEFYQFLADKNANVSTCQPSIEMVKEEWRNLLKEYNEIVYIVLSSGLSESCNNAINASHDPEFEGKVFVPNNQRVAFLNKIQMYQARALIDAGKNAKDQGINSVEVYVKGPGNGRETAIRALQTAGLDITMIKDVSPIPHNGCRPPKRRRI